ncbi:MAG: protein translocase subunit SecD [Acidiferrobacteraceae bacterium]|jgi:preprotein translocase subunit SecD
MNRYPLWKYLLILAVVLLGALYAVPNLFGEDPAIQVSAKRNAPIDQSVMSQVHRALDERKLAIRSMVMDGKNILVRFADTDTQLKARDIVQRELGDGYTVAINLLPATPHWLSAIAARPMYLGLDLRGGVHFLMQVDMDAVVKKAEQSYTGDIRRILRENHIRYLTVINRPGHGIEIRFRDEAERNKGRAEIEKEERDLKLADTQGDRSFNLVATISQESLVQKRRQALEQNMTSLRNRVNELGVAEPIVQQQGEDRIVVELPGVQDTAKAKEIIGRVATLEVKLVDEEHDVQAALAGAVPPGDRIYRDRDGRPYLIKDQLIYSGDNIENASPSVDSRSNQPIVSITLDSRGAAINQRVTGENINKRMAVIYVETRSKTKLDDKGNPVLDDKGNPVQVRQKIEQVITAPVIKQQLGKRFQIEGLESFDEANDIALLLRAGALAAPISIVEERTIGPSLGQENIDQGLRSIIIGFVAVILFMLLYYRVFGVFANVALALNLVLIVAVLSLFQATLTLPGVAGMLLTVGMAVDANVLIYERIREELRNGSTPQASIHAGYAKAFGTIADANITTLIAAVMLFNFGTGPIKGFAITLSIGILTSMFTAIMVTRALANLTYGGRRVKKLLV